MHYLRIGLTYQLSFFLFWGNLYVLLSIEIFVFYCGAYHCFYRYTDAFFYCVLLIMYWSVIFYECICFYLTVSESDIIKLFNQSLSRWTLCYYYPAIKIDPLWKRTFFLTFICYHIITIYVGGASLPNPETVCRLHIVVVIIIITVAVQVCVVDVVFVVVWYL